MRRRRGWEEEIGKIGEMEEGRPPLVPSAKAAQELPHIVHLAPSVMRGFLPPHTHSQQ